MKGSPSLCVKKPCYFRIPFALHKKGSPKSRLTQDSWWRAFSVRGLDVQTTTFHTERGCHYLLSIKYGYQYMYIYIYIYIAMVIVMLMGIAAMH